MLQGWLGYTILNIFGYVLKRGSESHSWSGLKENFFKSDVVSFTENT